MKLVAYTIASLFLSFGATPASQFESIDSNTARLTTPAIYSGVLEAVNTSKKRKAECSVTAEELTAVFALNRNSLEFPDYTARRAKRGASKRSARFKLTWKSETEKRSFRIRLKQKRDNTIRVILKENVSLRGQGQAGGCKFKYRGDFTPESQV